MESIQVARLDHHGIVAGIIDELKIVEIIDGQIEADDQEEVSTGEAVKAMIINGLGFSNRPLVLTPQFFENLPMDALFRKGVEASHFNRYKLGRSLDKVFDYGSELLFSMVAAFGCHQENVDQRFNSLDSTSFSLNGEYSIEEDKKTINITHGHSKDHRPDLKQVMLELMVSQDGGVPFVSKSWDGNGSDNVIFEKRAAALIDEFKASEAPRYWVGDSKLYHKKAKDTLSQIPFITRIPGSLKLEQNVVDQALSDPLQWVDLDNGNRYQRFNLCHYEMEQRWLVIHSQAALGRARSTLERRQEKESKKIEKALFHLQAQRFESETAEKIALNELAKTWKFHQVNDTSLTPHKRYSKKGRPNAQAQTTGTAWQINATFSVDENYIETQSQRNACFVIGSNINGDELTDIEIFHGYKSQSNVEGGFRFLKDPLFFVSSLFLKKPSRIEALLMIMTLSLFVYSIAQRRIRANLKSQNQIIPNQINQPVQHPTLRWIFQLFEGINFITHNVNNTIKIMVDGLSDLRKKILRLLGPTVCRIYQISSERG
ncbi:MAG: IS1634 family transposase [Thiomicrorhabdus sp.]|nr:IS1634 family transposase [Thiomicrorhabdus sp.]